MLTANPALQAVSEDMVNHQQTDRESIGKAIGRIESGVFVVTMEKDGLRQGLMASWVCQAAFEPPIISVAVKKDRPILELLEPGSRFTVNFLSKQNMDIFKNFAKPYTEGLDRFEGLTTESR